MCIILLYGKLDFLPFLGIEQNTFFLAIKAITSAVVSHPTIKSLDTISFTNSFSLEVFNCNFSYFLNNLLYFFLFSEGWNRILTNEICEIFLLITDKKFKKFCNAENSSYL